MTARQMIIAAKPERPSSTDGIKHNTPMNKKILNKSVNKTSKLNGPNLTAKRNNRKHGCNSADNREQYGVREGHALFLLR